METFDFPYHTVETDNPDSGYRVQLGGSYVFTTPPTDPDQRTFTLRFPVMKFFLNGSGVLDSTIKPEINMKRLIDFYQNHKLYKSFQYNHPIHGLLVVKFNKPLKEPEGIVNGDGATKEVTIELIETP